MGRGQTSRICSLEVCDVRAAGSGGQGRGAVSVDSSLFIVFEGIDLCGKTTQARMLQRWFAERGQEAILTQEPTEKGLYGRHLRMELQGMLRLIQARDELSEEIVRAKLFALDRFIHLRNEIEPHLAQGVHVICDRYYLSSLVYQSVELRRLGYALMDPLERVKQLNADALYADTQPDLIVLIDIPIPVWTERMRQRPGENEIYEQEEQRAEIRKAYRRAIELLDAAGALGASERPRRERVRVETVRYEDGFQTREQVHREVVRLVESVMRTP
jgi:dTMP kinase